MLLFTMLTDDFQFILCYQIFGSSGKIYIVGSLYSEVLLTNAAKMTLEGRS
jgi:hypothetical protein